MCDGGEDGNSAALHHQLRANRKASNKRTDNTKVKPTSRNAARERSRVRSLRNAFQMLQDSLPAVPRHTKLSKLDVLILASTYIAHLTQILNLYPESTQCLAAHLHPVKKWPMRSRLYAGIQFNSYMPSSEISFETNNEQHNLDVQDDFYWLNEELNNELYGACYLLQ